MLSYPAGAVSMMLLIRSLSLFTASVRIWFTKSGYAASRAGAFLIFSSIVPFPPFSSLGSIFCKPPWAGLFNNIVGTVLNRDRSSGTELTMTFRAFSITVCGSASNMMESQKPFSTA